MLQQIEDKLDWLENVMRSASLNQLAELHAEYDAVLIQLRNVITPCTSS